MKKINFTTLKKIVLIAIAVSFVIWSCQDEKTTIYTSKDNPTVQEKITEQEWQQMRKSEPFITAYNDLVTINIIMEDTGLTYDELLEYAYKEESRYKYQQKVEKSLIKDFIIEDVQSFDATLKALVRVNEKVEKSSYLQELLIRQLYSYTWYIEDNMDKIAAFYIKKREAEIASSTPNLAARRTPDCYDRRMKVGSDGVAYTLTSEEVIIRATPRITRPYVRPSFYYPTFTYNPNRRGNGIRFPRIPTRPHYYGGTRTKIKPKRVRFVYNKLTNPCAKRVFLFLNEEREISPFEINKHFGNKLSFSGEVLELFKNSGKFNYIIKNGKYKNNGITIKKYNNYITTISDSYLKKATTLSIARTMIHESVHAYILHKTRYNQSFYKSIEVYAKKYGYNNSKRFHHEFMVQYVNAMAASLFLWDRRYNPRESYHSWDYYHAMAFGGLFYEDSNGNLVETDSFKKLVPKKSDRDKIIQILKIEQDGNRKAKGKKCN